MTNPPPAFQQTYGPWAVVAGASAGLGAAFATELAARGLHLVVIARRPERLAVLAARLTEEYHVQVRCLPLDLARPDVAGRVAAGTDDLDIGLLIYNAAHAAIGPFFEQPLAEHVAELDLNCRSALILVYTLGRRLLQRGRGGIVVMSSLSAAHGAPLVAHYAATKAYAQILSEGLWDEVRQHGIDVVTCRAGATATPNYWASTPRHSRPFATPVLAPEAVVREALAGLGKRPSVVPGRANRLAALVLERLLPRRRAIILLGRTLRAMYGR